MDVYTVREAKPEEQGELTRLAVRATLRAGHDDAFIDRSMPALTTTLPFISGNFVRVAQDAFSEVVGVASVTPTRTAGDSVASCPFRRSGALETRDRSNSFQGGCRACKRAESRRPRDFCRTFRGRVLSADGSHQDRRRTILLLTRDRAALLLVYHSSSDLILAAGCRALELKAPFKQLCCGCVKGGRRARVLR
jgi:hypothetical protein